MPLSIRLPQHVAAKLDDLKDIYLAERELTEVRAGRSTPVPLSEVMAEYGLED